MKMTKENIEILISEIIHRTSRDLISKQRVRDKLEKYYKTILQEEFNKEWEFVFGLEPYNPG